VDVFVTEERENFFFSIAERGGLTGYVRISPLGGKLS
jgi:hypothetical protein